MGKNACDHGQLKRVCNICELENRIAKYRALLQEMLYYEVLPRGARIQDRIRKALKEEDDEITRQV